MTGPTIAKHVGHVLGFFFTKNVFVHQKLASGARSELGNLNLLLGIQTDHFGDPAAAGRRHQLPGRRPPPPPAAGHRRRRPPLYIQTSDQPPLAAILDIIIIIIMIIIIIIQIYFKK